MSVLDAPSGGRPRLSRKTVLARSAVIFIFGPALIYLLYLVLLAPARYTSTTSFAVRGAQAQSSDALSAVGLIAPTSTTTDARIVDDYIKSQAMVGALRERYGFGRAYAYPSLDPWSRLSERASPESATQFWRKHVKVTFDPATSATTVRVSAYRPEDALRLSRGALTLGEELVNRMTARAASDLSEVAQQEIERKRVDYEAARDRLASYQGRRSSVDINTPQEQAVALVGNLDAQLAQKRTELAASSQTYQPDAPQLTGLRREIAALEAERARAVSRAVSAPGEGATDAQLEAQSVLMDYEFAQRAYQSAVQAAEAARRQNLTDRKYVVAYIPPELPQKNDWWSRLGNVLAVLIGSAILWGLGALTYSIIRDHME
ncbi:MAG: hypothetical protein EON88_09315 [Brevundimonas sp.]|nr:MAG: hypothetical protein EON88_09315 [Brevundimonas sp.]